MQKYNSWHTGASIYWTGKENSLEEESGVGDGRVEGSPAVEDRRQVAVPHMPDTDGMYIRIFETSQLGGSYEGHLLYIVMEGGTVNVPLM